MNFSEDIKFIRNKQLLTQEEFAKQLGVSFTTVNRWESGKVKPSFRTLKLIDNYCKIHHIDIDITETLTEVNKL